MSTSGFYCNPSKKAALKQIKFIKGSVPRRLWCDLPVWEAIKILQVLFEHQQEQNTLWSAGKLLQRGGVFRQTVHHCIFIVQIRVGVTASRLLSLTDLLLLVTAAATATAAGCAALLFVLVFLLVRAVFPLTRMLLFSLLCLDLLFVSYWLFP